MIGNARNIEPEAYCSDFFSIFYICAFIKRIRTSNKRRFKRRLKGFKKKYNRYETGLDEIKRGLSSYNGHLKQGYTYRLRRNIYSKFVLTHARKEECISTDNDAIKTSREDVGK